MEKLSFVKNGVFRLPPGFRFHPTDEELVVQYLKRKVLSCPLPVSIIPEVDVCRADPWDLPGDLEKERYFFSTREAKYPNGNRSNRSTGSGYWKATGIDKRVATTRGNQIVGLKKTLVFYRGKPPNGFRTDWIMHEYRLASPSPQINTTQNSVVPMESWVLCRIFLKKRGNKTEDEGVQSTNPTGFGRIRSNNIQKDEKDVDKPAAAATNSNRNSNVGPVFFEFLKRERTTDLNLAPCCSSSDSSGVTEVSCNESDGHEESSSCNNFPNFRRKF